MTAKNIPLLTLSLCVLLTAVVQEAYATQVLGASARYVEGKASFAGDFGRAPRRPVTVGVSFAEGDRIFTEANGRVEVGFGSGGLILIDNSSEFIFGPKTVESGGFINAMVSLVIGRIKSSISKRSAADKFEYHTKSAIIGIAGTPEHIIESVLGAGGQAKSNVFLAPGKTGALNVIGSDPARTSVILNPGMETSALFGSAPAAPIALSSAALQLFKQLSFKSLGAAASGSGGTFVEGNVTGTAVDPSGKTLANQTIQIFNKSGEMVLSTTSGANGTFSLNSLVAGEYTMTVGNVVAPLNIVPAGAMAASASAATAFQVVIAGSGGSIGAGAAAAGAGLTIGQWAVVGGAVVLGGAAADAVVNNNNAS